MRKLNFIVMMAIAAGMILFAASAAKCNSILTFDGGGYVSTFFAGSEWDLMTFEFSNGNNDCDERYDILSIDDVLNVTGDYYFGLQSYNCFTIDRIVIVNNGAVGFAQTYLDGQGRYGYIGSFLTSDGLGILCSSGFSTAVMADAGFEMSQYAGRSNPHLTSTEVTVSSLGVEGLGSSQMSAQLYGDWYSPSYHIFEYWNDSWVDDSEKTGFVDVELTGDDGLDVDISSSWTTPWIDIEIYSIL